MADETVRKTLMATLIEADCMVLEISAEKASLEQVFVKLTTPDRKKTRAEEFEELAQKLEADRLAEEAENPYNDEEGDA